MSGPSFKLGRWAGAAVSTPLATLKAPVTGIMPRTVQNVKGRQADLGGVVANVFWSNLQPTEGADIVTSGTGYGTYGDLTDALATGLPVRVRVHCGDDSPTWAKNLGGPLTILDAESGSSKSSTVPRWWRADFLAAWDDLMRKLAALWDANAQIREIASHPATTVYAEPMQRGVRSSTSQGQANAKTIYLAMYGDNSTPGYASVQVAGGAAIGPAKLDENALLWPAQRVLVGGESISRWRSYGWETTRLYLPHNPLQQWRVAAPPPAPFSYTYSGDPGGWTAYAMDYYSASLRNRVLLGNNSLSVPLGSAGGNYPEMWANLSATARGNSYQTATLSRLLDRYRTKVPTGTQSQALAATLDVGFGITTSANDSPDGLVSAPVTRLRARSIELPDGWSPYVTASQAATWNAAAAANPTGD